jgi:hypothetical protein
MLASPEVEAASAAPTSSGTEVEALVYVVAVEAEAAFMTHFSVYGLHRAKKP